MEYIVAEDEQHKMLRGEPALRIATNSPLGIFSAGIDNFPLAFSLDWSDQSSCAVQAQKRVTKHMTTAETTATDKAATVAAQGAHVAPAKAPAKKAASRKNGALRAKKTAKAGKTKAAPPKKSVRPGVTASKKAAKPERNANAPRAESKGAKILEMIGRAKGVTLAEIMKATDWQAHSVRGFISTAGKKHGVKIESAKNDAGERSYRIAK
jgi:hypothetical protein